MENKPPARWKADEQVNEIAARTRAFRAELERRREAMTPPCPEDGTPGTYSGTIGSYQIVVPLFTCERGHRFSWRSDLNRGKLYTGQGETPKAGQAK